MSGKNTGKISGFSKFIAGKGFYIVLLLCVAVVGAAAWAILFYPSEKTAAPDELAVYSGTEPATHNDAPSVFTLPNIDAEPVISPEVQAIQPETVSVPPSEPPVADTVTESEATPVMAPLPVTQAPDHYVWPLSGGIELPYAVSSLVYNRTMADWRTHNGIDIAANLGAKVMAVAPGTVSEIYDDDMYGTTVIISHGSGIESVYSNLAATPAVSVDSKVSLGDVIGAVGDTALCESADVTHLHFEMRADGNAADPLEYLPDR